MLREPEAGWTRPVGADSSAELSQGCGSSPTDCLGAVSDPFSSAAPAVPRLVLSLALFIPRQQMHNSH